MSSTSLQDVMPWIRPPTGDPEAELIYHLASRFCQCSQQSQQMESTKSATAEVLIYFRDLPLRIRKFIPAAAQDVIMVDVIGYLTAQRGDSGSWRQFEPPIVYNIASGHECLRLLRRYYCYIVYFYMLGAAQRHHAHRIGVAKLRKEHLKEHLDNLRAQTLSTDELSAAVMEQIVPSLDQWKHKNIKSEQKARQWQIDFAKNSFRYIQLLLRHRRRVQRQLRPWQSEIIYTLGSYGTPAFDPGFCPVLFPSAGAPSKRTCDCCTLETWTSMRKCGGCGSKRYCSTFCQMMMWPSHREECSHKAGTDKV